MGLFDIIGTVLKFLISLWQAHNQVDDPAVAKAKAVAAATSDLNDDVEGFNEALKNNDANAIAAHFQMLGDRIKAHTNGNT